MPMGMPGGASMGLAGVNLSGSRWKSLMRSMMAVRWMASAVSVGGGCGGPLLEEVVDVGAGDGAGLAGGLRD